MSYEQIYRNEYNLNKLPFELFSKKGGLASDIVKEIICLGLRSVNSTEMIVTLLELVYFLCEQKEILGKTDLHIICLVVVQCLIEIMTLGENIDKGMKNK